MISHSSSQQIAAMTLWDTSEFPERFLNSGIERFKRFRKTERHTFDITVRQHAVKECVIKSLSGNLYAQFIAHGEVTGGQSFGMMLLIKEDHLTRTMQTPPPVDTPLIRLTCRIRKLPIVSLLRPLKQCPGFEPRFRQVAPGSCPRPLRRDQCECSSSARPFAMMMARRHRGTNRKTNCGQTL